jgi:uroporphyrinogen-III synthase
VLVLLTRPRDEAARSAAKLAAIGHTAVLSPVIEFVPTGAVWPQGVIDAVIATSARAFQFLPHAQEWLLPEACRLYPLFLVGAKTAEAARAGGFEGPARITLDAKALCSVISHRFEAPTRVLYLAGRDRKSDLEACSTEAGVALEVVETYAAQAAARLSDEAVRLVAAGALGAVVHFSRRSAEIFLRLAADAGLDPAPLVHVAISADAAAPLQAAALPQIVVANEPNEEAILALLRQAAELGT